MGRHRKVNDSHLLDLFEDDHGSVTVGSEEDRSWVALNEHLRQKRREEGKGARRLEPLELAGYNNAKSKEVRVRQTELKGSLSFIHIGPWG